MTTIPLTRQQLQTWRLFITTHATAVGNIEQTLDQAGHLPLSSYDVLLALVEAPNRRLRMSELADEVVLSRSGLTRLVERLEREGYLKRERTPIDKRAMYAVLTLKGFRAFRKTWPIYAQSIAQYFAQYITPEDLETLTRILSHLPTTPTNKQ